MIDDWGISCENDLRWMSLDLSDDESTLVQVMAWCRQATSHYLSQCWPRSLLPYGVTKPQWVKENHVLSYYICVPNKSESHMLEISVDALWFISLFLHGDILNGYASRITLWSPVMWSFDIFFLFASTKRWKKNASDMKSCDTHVASL